MIHQESIAILELMAQSTDWWHEATVHARLLHRTHTEDARLFAAGRRDVPQRVPFDTVLRAYRTAGNVYAANLRREGFVLVRHQWVTGPPPGSSDRHGLGRCDNGRRGTTGRCIPYTPQEEETA